MKSRCKNTCPIHINGKYIKWTCGKVYSPIERRNRYILNKINCKSCGKKCTKSPCRKCWGKFNSSHLLGKKLPDWWCNRISKGQGRGKKNRNYKGEKVTYSTKHKSLVRYHGNPPSCEKCSLIGCKNKGGKWNIQWASKYKNYTRNVKDYIGLCARCHSIFDGKTKNINDYDHGELGKYVKGCRCDLCKLAKKNSR